MKYDASTKALWACARVSSLRDLRAARHARILYSSGDSVIKLYI